MTDAPRSVSLLWFSPHADASRLTPDAALFLDFDGTLVAIADTPEAIEVPTRWSRYLKTCTTCWAARWQSSRAGRSTCSTAFSRRCACLPPASTACSAAMRRSDEGQRAPDLTEVLATANELARVYEGLLVERKHAAIALHYRLAPQLEAVCRDALTRVIRDQPQLELLHGKFVFEVKPAGINKGIAIDAFMHEPPFAGRVPVFAGDDTTDETGFAVVQPLGGIAIKVGSGPSQALHRLDSPRAVFEWLVQARDLLAAPESPTDAPRTRT
ncbi:MAG: trehalose-phosphatase [Variovorax sp.]